MRFLCFLAILSVIVAGRSGAKAAVTAADSAPPLRDLLGVAVNVKDMLPLDSSAEGFDNVGDALHTSSFLLACYLEAAEEALNQAIANRPQPKIDTKRVTLNDAHQVRSSKEGVFRKSSDGRVVMFSSSRWVA